MEVSESMCTRGNRIRYALSAAKTVVYGSVWDPRAAAAPPVRTVGLTHHFQWDSVLAHDDVLLM